MGGEQWARTTLADLLADAGLRQDAIFGTSARDPATRAQDNVNGVSLGEAAAPRAAVASPADTVSPVAAATPMVATSAASTAPAPRAAASPSAVPPSAAAANQARSSIAYGRASAGLGVTGAGVGAGPLAISVDEKPWCMKRDWTDENFQRGAEANATRLQEFEDILVGKMRESALNASSAASASSSDEATSSGDALAHVLGYDVRSEVLRDPEILGSALDIVGAYLKNYEVDKACAVMETVLPVCREKGPLWLLKALNHMATVRMKQSLPEEALKCLQEIEVVAGSSLSEPEMDEAWEFWETTYRNFGWIMSSMGRESEAVAYIRRAVDVKERVGLPASWFDLWDLGRMTATSAFKSDDPEKIAECQGTVTRSLWLHSEAEPEDQVMRAKIWHTVGECSFALAHLAEKHHSASSGTEIIVDLHAPTASPEAREHYRKAVYGLKQAHSLFLKTEGRTNHLTGSAAEAVAWCLLKIGEDEESKDFLLNALEASAAQQNAWGDGVDSASAPALENAVRVVDQVLEVHRRTDDRWNLIRFFAPIETLCANVAARLGPPSARRADASLRELLVSSCSLLLVAAGTSDGKERAQNLMRQYMVEAPSTQRAQLSRAMLFALPGQAPDFAGLIAAAVGSDLEGAAPLLDQIRQLTARRAVARRRDSWRFGCGRTLIAILAGGAGAASPRWRRSSARLPAAQARVRQRAATELPWRSRSQAAAAWPRVLCGVPCAVMNAVGL